MLCKCDNCGFTCPKEDIKRTVFDFSHEELMSRVGPSGSVPDGECPECGSLTYEIHPEEPINDLVKVISTLINQSRVSFISEKEKEDVLELISKVNTSIN